VSTPLPLRVAVVGCGDIAQLHLEIIRSQPDAVLVAVADSDPTICRSTAERFSVNGYTDYTQMLDAEQLDVVHLCTPHHLHVEMAIAGLDRSINVLTEKPVATTISDAHRLIKAAERGPAQVGVCFQNRYNPTSRAMDEALRSQRFGRILGAVASVTWFRDRAYYLAKPWRGRPETAGGGVLINQAIHTLDLLQWFLGDAVDVRGRASTLLLSDTIEVEDNAHLVLTHDSGARSVLYATNNSVDNAPVTIEVRTESAVLRLTADLSVIHPDGRQEILATDGRPVGEKAYWGDSHGRLIADFYRHVRTGEHFWVDATEATKTLSIIRSVYEQSTIAGRRPVSH
jgi:predicted dehydrogenase